MKVEIKNFIYKGKKQVLCDPIRIQPHLNFIIGPNGSGKTCLLNACNRKLSLTKQSFLYMRSHFWIDPNLSLSELIAIYNVDPKHEIVAKLEVLPFMAKKYASLSSGEKQRCMLALCLAQDVDIYLLDEPLNYLDIFFQEVLFQYIEKEKQKSFIVANHDLNWMRKFSSPYHVLIQDGELRHQGFGQDFWSSPQFQLSFRLENFSF